MFAASMTEDEINRSGAASDLRYFHTTYGDNMGYNERARKFHRSYGLVTPPTQSAFDELRAGDLATAPIYRRDQLGFRREYQDKPFTWAEKASKLKKNQKTYGDEQNKGPQHMTFPPLPVKEVKWRGAGSPSYEAKQRQQQQQQPISFPDPASPSRTQQAQSASSQQPAAFTTTFTSPSSPVPYRLP